MSGGLRLRMLLLLVTAGIVFGSGHLVMLRIEERVQQEALLAYSRQQRISAELLAAQVRSALEPYVRWADELVANPSAPRDEMRIRLRIPDGVEPVVVDDPKVTAPLCARCGPRGTLAAVSPPTPDGSRVVVGVPLDVVAEVLRPAWGWMPDGTGRIVAHHDIEQVGTRPFVPDRDDPAVAEMIAAIGAGGSGFTSYRWPDEAGASRRFAAYHQLYPEVGIAVAVSRDESEALGGVQRSLGVMQGVGLTLFASFGLTTIAVIWLTGQIARERRDRERTELARADVLAHTERLAQIGELTAGVAHDLRVPLGALRLGVEELEEDRLGDSALRENLRTSVDMMMDIAADLLRFSRADRSTGHEVSEVSATLRSTFRMIGPERRSRCELAVSDEECWVAMAGPRLGQVLVNLIDNALAVADEVRVSCRDLDDEVLVIVEDDGPGIPPEQREAVFEPFFTTKPPGQGTGLGLNLCRRFVEERGGSVTVGESSLGGAAFTLRLQRHHPERQSKVA